MREIAPLQDDHEKHLHVVGRRRDVFKLGTFVIVGVGDVFPIFDLIGETDRLQAIRKIIIGVDGAEVLP